MKFIELFAGIGGFRYGLESVDREAYRRSQKIEENGNSERHKKSKGTNAEGGQPSEHSDNRGCEKQFTCVYANEFNKYAAQIYKERFKDEIDTRDIREVDASEIPDHELLTAGFPCQAFSIAGKRGGFEDTRGTLFFEIARIAKQKQPRLLLLENVKGLLSHDKGKTFGTILNTLDELGYDCQWQVLNSKNFGVPQNRERVFIIGHLRGTSRPEVFPIGGQAGEDNTDDGAVSLGGWFERPDALRAEYVSRAPLRFLKRNQKKMDGNYSFTVDGASTGGVLTATVDEMYIRRLTPTECERLQGFQDGWTEGLSDTQRYKCLGNAVTTNVITAIGERLQSLDKGDGE